MKGGKTKMDKSVQITLIIVIGVIAIIGLGYLIINQANPSNTVTGRGVASLDATPDLVGVYFSIETTGETSQEATQENAEIVDDLITDLMKKGFDRKEITTMNFNVYPDYDWDEGQREEQGYRAVHTLKVELSTDASALIGTVIDSGVGAGAGISHISFELSQEKQNEYKAEAIKLAAEDAKIKAQAIADGLGKKLGSLVSTSDSDFRYRPWDVYRATEAGSDENVVMAKQAATNINPGEQQITAQVTAVFRLK